MGKVASNLNFSYSLLIFVLLVMFLCIFSSTELQASHNAQASRNTQASSNAQAPRNTQTSRNAQEHRPFAEYIASYRLHWHGLHVGKSLHTVRRLAPNHYTAEAKSEPRLAIIPLKDYEKSEFQVKQHEMQPIAYEYLSKERRKKIIGRMNFNWKDLTVTKVLEKGSETSSALPEKAQDMITQLFQVRQGLRLGQKAFDFKIFSPKGVKDYHYEVIGEETIQTPVGTFNTLVVEHISKEKDRRTRFWLAEDLDFMMIRLMQIKKGKITAEAMIESLNWL